MSMDTPKGKHCDYNNFKRARYFHGMLMTDRDFTEEQLYHNEKRKMLNRMLHGWGVVCGLKITPTNPASSKIVIERGMALDCRGSEIVLCDKYELDVLDWIKSCAIAKRKPTTKEECEKLEKEEENKWYVVVRYKEVPTDPVPVYIPSGSCEEKVCEYSRIREGYCFDLVKTVECPERLKENDGPCEEWKNVSTNASDEEKGKVRKFLCEDLLMTCPGVCCDDPVVVLGSITVKTAINPGTKIETLMINNWDCRKYVITFGLLEFWMGKLAPKKLPLDAIVNYAMLGDACESLESAVAAFQDICSEEGEGGGQAMVRVPNVVKQDLNIAREMLKKANLTVGAISMVEAPTQSGTVLSQNPTAGAMVSPGTPVNLRVAKKTGKSVADIKGIGPVGAEKLAKAGIKDLESLAKADPEVVMKALDIKDKEKAAAYIKEAQKILANT